MQPLPRTSGNAPKLLLEGLQGQFLLRQKDRIFFYKMMFAQKVNLLFSYFVAVTVCRDQSKDCYKNEQKVLTFKFSGENEMIVSPGIFVGCRPEN